MRRFALAAAMLILATSLSCRDRRDDQVGGVSDTVTSPAPAPEFRDTAPAERGFSFDQRQEFTQSIRQQLADFDRQITELASQAKSRGGAVSDRALANVRASRRTVDRSLGRVDAATAANWEQVRQGVNQAVDQLSESIVAAQPK
jgi:hypothetical protein